MTRSRPTLCHIIRLSTARGWSPCQAHPGQIDRMMQVLVGRPQLALKPYAYDS